MTPPALAHRIDGDGPPVVLLNGGMMSLAAWEPVASALCAHYRVLRLDFRGQLRSPGTPPASLAGHAADVAELLDQVGWESAHLVGTSFGAEVAIELAAAAPARVRSLLAVTAIDRADAAFTRSAGAMREILAGIAVPGARERFWDTMVGEVYSPEFRTRRGAELAARRAQLELLPPAWFAGVERLLRAVESLDLTPRLPAVRCPSRVVVAGDDRVMSAVRSHQLATALSADIITHPTSGHALVAEQPEWLAGICRDFLDRVHSEPVTPR